ncbi:MFS transporter [Echinicola vietnamensis]|uniref:Major Facilitator Superfamily transporter n=1 Tax=Echinicola vietnamensis (strain DSM 17526 / LMG 23754 / KMM 6221) TaxID=926556 RepID=L0G2L8_ECHVK|nr:MFS transporter [Echinicola vietnamensis]AGA79080.1 Major Facilitator Superfamily transporter [Echinicola vietnamensis DSM 17526]
MQAQIEKKKLSFWQIWNMSFGFLGIQMGFALQNANASRILQTFGADVEHLSLFWLVAPITGMIIQPIIGHYSDRTWTKLGRRRPYFLAGAVLAAIGLVLMPNASLFVAYLPALWVGAGFLMIMDASFNVAMEPFRALVADKLPTDQRTLGFAVQTLLIGLGAVIGSWLPYVLTEWFSIPTTANEGIVPQNVLWAFIIGATILVASILWTVLRTSEYPPDELEKSAHKIDKNAQRGLSSIFTDFIKMPKTMKQLGLVQFFSWFALFSMWVFSTPALAQHVWGLPSSDRSSLEFNEAGNYVGVIFGVYNLVSALFAMTLPVIAAKIGRKMTHAICLLIGGTGLISILWVTDPEMKWVLNLSMIGVGIAWASILAMPYAILAGSIPAKKMGVYMGIFNFFITAPQILNGFIGGWIVRYIYGGQAIYALFSAGLFLILAAMLTYFVEDKDDGAIA